MTTLKFIPKTFLLSLLMVVPFFIACKDKETTTIETNEAVQEATLDQKKQMLDNVVPSTNSANSADMGALNPQHGQPGHRCDIPVGAPLNGNAATPNATPVQSNTTPIKVADGLNPPHGQPGHRCDVKVGDPL